MALLNASEPSCVSQAGTLRCYLSADAQIWLMTLYAKDEMADLSAAEKRALKAALEAEFARRAARRRLRRK